MLFLALWWCCFAGGDVATVKSKSVNFADFGRFEAVVALEAHDDALIGEVTFAKIDPHDGHILVQGENHSGLIHRFDRRGKYLLTYGSLISKSMSPGPGEYTYLYDFVITASGNVVVFDYMRTLVFSREGEFIREKRESVSYMRGVYLGGKIYVHTNHGRFFPDKESIYILDEDLEKIGQFFPWDARWDIWRVTPFRYLTTHGGNIYVADAYDFTIAAYNPAGELLRRYEFGKADFDLAELKSASDRKSRRELFQRLNRSVFTYGLEQGLFAYYYNGYSRSYAPCLLDVGKNRLLRYDRLGFVFSGQKEGLAVMNHIAGRYENGLICVINDEKRLEHSRPFIPQLEAIKPGSLENPVLCFLKVN